MNKNKIVLILVIITLITIIVLSIYTTSLREVTISVDKADSCEMRLILTGDDYNIYYYCVDSVDVKINNYKYLFEDAIEKKYINIDEIIDMMTINSEQEDSVLYTGEGFRLLNCNNKKIIIGHSNMEYEESFCK